MGKVDRLAEIRAEIRALNAEAKLIRQGIIAGIDPLRDYEHIAQITPHVVLRPVARVEPIARNNGAYSYAD